MRKNSKRDPGILLIALEDKGIISHVLLGIEVWFNFCNLLISWLLDVCVLTSRFMSREWCPEAGIAHLPQHQAGPNDGALTSITLEIR